MSWRRGNRCLPPECTALPAFALGDACGLRSPPDFSSQGAEDFSSHDFPSPPSPSARASAAERIDACTPPAPGSSRNGDIARSSLTSRPKLSTGTPSPRDSRRVSPFVVRGRKWLRRVPLRKSRSRFFCTGGRRSQSAPAPEHRWPTPRRMVPPPTLIDIICLLGISAIVPTIRPTCRVRLGQQPAGQVVLVPSRHDEDDRSSRPQPRQQIGLPPIPMMGPGCSASARGGRRGRPTPNTVRAFVAGWIETIRLHSYPQGRHYSYPQGRHSSAG